MICSPQNPRCLICPIRSGCQSHAFGTTSQLPVKKKKQKQARKKMEVGILKQNGALFFVKRPGSGLLSSMWSFPIVETTAGGGEDIKKKLGEFFPELSAPVFIGESRHVFSHIIWEMSLYRFDVESQVCEPPQAYPADETVDDPPNHCRRLIIAPTNSSDETVDALPIKTQFKGRAAIDDLALPVAFSKLFALIDDAQLQIDAK